MLPQFPGGWYRYDMEARSEEDGDMILIHLEGEIDLHHSPRLRSILQEKAGSKCPCLVVNFEQVSYIDSSGLATFVEYYQEARKFEGKVALAAMSQRVRSVFELVRLTEVFSIYGTVDEARTALRGT